MLTKKELAELYKISVPTVDRLMKDGMPYYKIGRSVRFEVDEVKDWMKEEK